MLCRIGASDDDTMITIRESRPDDGGDIHALLREYARSLPFALDFQRFDEELAALPEPYLPPRGLLLLVEDGHGPMGIGAFRPFDAQAAEIKRMYLRPALRGHGAGAALLDALIARARSAGYARVRLDSHRASMTTAIALYRSRGFVEVPPFGPDLDGALAFFERAL